MMKAKLNMNVRIFFYWSEYFHFSLVMQRAWRERTPSTRIQLAHDALEKNSE